MTTVVAIPAVRTSRSLPRTRNVRALPRKDWALQVYIGGDNNLSDAGLEDITEMCEEGSNARLHVGVEIDTYGEHDGSIRYEISEPDETGAAHRIVIERLPEQDHGDPTTFLNFLDWGLGRYPAKKRMLVVWNHGSGFRKRRRRDIASDDFGSSLDMPEVDRALERAGVGPGKKYGKLKIIGFDACLMSMIEIVHHFRDRSEFVVGSQQLEPGDGWPYNDVLAKLKADPSPRTAAAAIVDAYIAEYRAKGEEDVTQSAIETAKTNDVIDKLHKLGKALQAALPAGYSAIARARNRTQAFDYADYVDLIHLCQRLQAVSINPVKIAAKALEQSARASVVAAKSIGASVKDSNGLSVWVPPDSRTYFANRSKYLALALNAEKKDWVEFLDAYFAA